MTRETQPAACLSLDLDDHWTYLKIHGEGGWEDFPSYLHLVVPRALDFLRERGLTITFFVVGQDAALERNREVLRSIAAAGHEIGNHSFHHDSWLHLYSEEAAEDEIATAAEAIEQATGARPLGFRGPGFSLSLSVLRSLVRRGYRYDASTLPTFLGPLARAYYFRTARLSGEEKRRRKALYGGFGEGLRPLKPYRWRTDSGTLIEIPTTTLPLLRLPIHVSYLLYLGGKAPGLARRYLDLALGWCRRSGIRPSLLLHSLDFVGGEEASDLSFFPAMDLASQRKLDMVSGFIDLFTRRYAVTTLLEYARDLARGPDLPLVEPNFRALGRAS